jgi:hypothetical protein
VPGATLALAALIAAAAATPADRFDDVTTPFVTRRAGEILVSVALNGGGPYWFLIDTGSSHSVIAADLVSRVGAVPAARTTVASPAGRETRLVVRIDRLVIGGQPSANVLASAVMRTALDPQGRIDGLLGQDVLAALRYTIDFRHRRIDWHRDRPRTMAAGETLRMSLKEGRFVLDLPQADGALRLVPDSGSQGLVLIADPTRPLPSFSPRPGVVELSTLTNRRAVRPIALEALQIGTRTLRDVPGVLVPRDPDAPDDDGLLPLHIFESVTFDGPAGTLTVRH